MGRIQQLFIRIEDLVLSRLLRKLHQGVGPVLTKWDVWMISPKNCLFKCRREKMLRACLKKAQKLINSWNNSLCHLKLSQPHWCITAQIKANRTNPKRFSKEPKIKTPTLKHRTVSSRKDRIKIRVSKMDQLPKVRLRQRRARLMMDTQFWPGLALNWMRLSERGIEISVIRWPMRRRHEEH